MPKRRPLVFLRKVSTLLKRSVRIAKLSTKPIIPRLILLKIKSRSNMHPKGYQYRFLMEYQFSPTGTPLIGYNSRELNRRRFRDMYRSLFYICGCSGKVTVSTPLNQDYGILGDASQGDTELDSFHGEEDSVDERAERFIEKFYEEMRMQRRASI